MRVLRQAVRSLFRSRAAALLSVLALALGIGVNVTTLISLQALLLHPFAYPDPDRLVVVNSHSDRSAGRESLSPGEFADLEKAPRVFESLAAWRPAEFLVRTSGIPDHLEGAVVTPSFFHVFGVAAVKGTTALSDARGVVISNAFWRSHLAGSRSAVGSTIRVGQVDRVITGILPDSFDFPLDTQVWIPFDWKGSERFDRSSRSLSVIARLAPDISPAQANVELAALARRAAEQYPQFNQHRNIDAILLRKSLLDEVTGHFLLTLCGAALFVLLLACVNVGNLQLARATRMQRQIAVQLALGAGRLQALRPFLVENLILASAASACGLILASWNNDQMKSHFPPAVLRLVPGLRTMHIDASVVAMTITLTFLASVLCTLPAGWFLYRTGSQTSSVHDWLRSRMGTSDAGTSRSSLRRTLIVSQLVLAMVLLLAAGLMVETFRHLLDRNQGFDPHNLLIARVSLPEGSSGSIPEQAIRFYDDFLQQISGRPGIVAVGLSSSFGSPDYFQIEGRPQLSTGDVHPDLASVNSQFLAAMRIPLLAGRNITDSDRNDHRHVAIVSKSLARRYWKNGRTPVGERVRFDAASGEWYTVVGICGNVVADWFTGVPAESVYVPYTQHPASWADLQVRTTSGDPTLQAPVLRSVVQHLNGDVALYGIKSQEQRNFEERFGVYSAATAMVRYAVIALVLALTGVYAVISVFVTSRRRDIAVRIALGARPSAVLSMILSEAARVLGLALIIGVPLSFLLARGMSSALYGVVDVNSAAIAAVATLLALAALSASLLPALRATRIDPVTALHEG